MLVLSVSCFTQRRRIKFQCMSVHAIYMHLVMVVNSNGFIVKFMTPPYSCQSGKENTLADYSGYLPIHVRHSWTVSYYM